MAITHNLGFPRIGPERELKFAVEGYWHGKLDAEALLNRAEALRHQNTLIQAASGLDWIPCGDFSLYDHVLDTSFLLGNIPARFQHQNPPITELDQYFLVARGRSRTGKPAFASEMTKWFDTNYHYLVPEFEQGTEFSAHPEQLLANMRASIAALQEAPNKHVKPVLLGPLTYLWLGKSKVPVDQRLALLETLLPVYQTLLAELHAAGAEWVQIDEPILALDLPGAWQQQFEPVYHRLQCRGLKVLLATYFGSVKHHAQLLTQLPVAGIHIDAVRGRDALAPIVDQLPAHKVLSVGVIDGRNIWKSDLEALLHWLEPLHQTLQDRLWLAPSCSLLHVPVDLSLETELDPELKSWLAFARQKLNELNTLKTALNQGRAAVADSLAANAEALSRRRSSPRVHNPVVQQRVDKVQPEDLQRASTYSERAERHRARWQLPAFATTTIGSFPQTPKIRASRHAYRQGQISEQQYREDMRVQIRYAIQQQEAIGLDVLVHGEAERNDMVEYFGEQLAGYGFTRFGWVQSYGSRCVKPPIIYGDVSRPQAMTVEWSQFAQSLTSKPMKGMLTGPITLLQWAFVRDDQPRAHTARQIALALRDEVQDLEAAGIGIIQVDEPALREGLPLHHSQWAAYLDWAVEAFRLATAVAAPSTQIHTHMCYSEFNDIMPAIAELDADVITIETARSDMELLDVFTDFAYPNEIGPGVYDIHSPNVPEVSQMVRLLQRAARHIPPERLWVNPDCGLKTRQWSEVVPALTAMVKAAQYLRERELATAAH